MNLTRRRFLGGLLASVPLAYVPLSRWRMKEAEYDIGFTAYPTATITAFTDGMLKGEWQGIPMDVRGRGEWRWFSATDHEGNIFETRVRRPKPNTLDVDYFVLRGPGVYYMDNFGNSRSLGVPMEPSAPQYSYQPLPPLLT
jgi:hypothetical protein